MVKVGLISDLHAEFLNEKEPIRSIVEQKINDINCEGLDVLCVAGDIDYQTRSGKFIKEKLLAKNPNMHIVFVLGNHDYWNGSLENTPLKVRDAVKLNKNIHFLDNEYVDLFGIRFIGTTLWTDYKGKDVVAMREGQSRMNDFKRIRTFCGTNKLLPVNLYNEHIRSKEFIFKTIRESTLPTIVLTHHVPYINSLTNNEDLIGYSFCSDLTFDLEELETKPLYWFFGHTHIFDKKEFLGTTIMCNPLGYYSEYNTSNFDLNCRAVEI